MNWSEEDLQDYLEKRRQDKIKIECAYRGKPFPSHDEMLEQRKAQKKLLKDKNKYHAKATKLDGILFASQFEAGYYSELKLKVRAGEVAGFIMQAKFLLQEGYTDNDGNDVKPIFYVADFVVWEASGKSYVVDTKGVVTDTYKLKKKMFKKRYPSFDFREVHKGE